MRELNPANLYRALAPAVLGYLRGRQVPEPEDVLGEVFLQVARDIKRFRGDGAAARRWVFSIAHNRAMDAHRRAGRDRATLRDSLDARAGTDTQTEQLDPELVTALGSLTEDQREVVVLRFVADLPLDAVARITGRNVGSTKALQHRALENLRRAVSPRDV